MSQPSKAQRIPAGEARDADEHAGETALNWVASFGAADRVMGELETEMRRIRRRRNRRVIGGVVAVALAGLVWRANFNSAGDGSPVAVSGRASALVVLPTKQILPDGSVVELKEGAEIAVDFSSVTRSVRLLRGEAHFQVAKNPPRLFVVSASGVEARAVGTAFSVQLGAASVEVLVTEGRVAVDHPALSAPSAAPTVPSAETASGRVVVAPPAMVDAGNRVVVELHAPTLARRDVEALSDAELAEKLSWRVPRLQFSGTPLAEVVTLFNRHSGSRLALADAALGRLQLSGVLRADNVDSLLRLLKLEFGIEAVTGAENETILRRR